MRRGEVLECEIVETFFTPSSTPCCRIFINSLKACPTPTQWSPTRPCWFAATRRPNAPGRGTRSSCRTRARSHPRFLCPPSFTVCELNCVKSPHFELSLSSPLKRLAARVLALPCCTGIHVDTPTGNAVSGVTGGRTWGCQTALPRTPGPGAAIGRAVAHHLKQLLPWRRAPAAAQAR